MRHPALTRFLAAFLAAVSAITLISGGICIKKAADSRKKQNTYVETLSAKADEAALLRGEINAMFDDYDADERAYNEMNERYTKDMQTYRKDLALYTATEAGLKQGREQLEEGYSGLRMGWIQHDNGLKALEEAEAQFLPGYEQYLSGKAQLEEGRRQLEQAEALKAQLPDIELVRAGLEAAEGSETALATTVDAIAAVVQNPPTDPETGEVDSAALQSQLSGYLSTLSSQLSDISSAMAGSYTPAEVQAMLAPAIDAVNAQAAALADGSKTAEELLAEVQAMIPAQQQIPTSFAGALAQAEQTLDMLEGLPAMRAQLDEAQKAIEETEPMLLQAKAGFDEGKKQLAAAKEMLIQVEAALIQGKEELEKKEAEQIETRADLDRRKEELERSSAELQERAEQIRDYTDKKDRFNTLRYALTADESIKPRVLAGEDLIDVSREELSRQRTETAREFALRLTAAIGMLLASAAGIVTVAAAFHDRQGLRLLLPAALAVALSAIGESVSLAAGRGLIYTVLFVGIFAAGVIGLNLKKA